MRYDTIRYESYPYLVSGGVCVCLALPKRPRLISPGATPRDISAASISTVPDLQEWVRVRVWVGYMFGGMFGGMRDG